MLIGRDVAPRILERLRSLIAPEAHISYSQEGEDMVLRRLFEGRRNGFYVDVGAHDPVRFSNTYFFYLQGWHGVNIDATPGSMERFASVRPRDKNIEAAISSRTQLLTYYQFNEPALNTFSQQLARERNGMAGYVVTQEQSLQTRTLGDVLEEHVPPSQRIDFLSVDVEGWDSEVLISNNWNVYRPEVILVEELPGASVDEPPANSASVGDLLGNLGYAPICRTVNTLIFKLRR